jgi:hypothetical protein
MTFLRGTAELVKNTSSVVGTTGRGTQSPTAAQTATSTSSLHIKRP